MCRVLQSACVRVGFVYWPVRWVTEQTVPRLGSSYGPGCSPHLLLQTFPRWPRVLQTPQRAPARPADSPRRADCWTEAAAAYLRGQRRQKLISNQTNLFRSHWTTTSRLCSTKILTIHHQSRLGFSWSPPCITVECRVLFPQRKKQWTNQLTIKLWLLFHMGLIFSHELCLENMAVNLCFNFHFTDYAHGRLAQD